MKELLYTLNSIVISATYQDGERVRLQAVI